MPDFEKVYEEFYPKILRYLSRMAGEEAAEDIAQETFMKIERGLGGFRGESKLSTWVYSVATNAAFDRLRASSAKPLAVLPLFDEGAAAEDSNVWSEEKMPTPEQMAIRREVNECIREFVEKLPPDYKTVMILSEIEGFKNREIADIIGVSLDTVKIRLHRGRAGLKKMLAAGCSFSRDERNTLSCDRRQK